MNEKPLEMFNPPHPGASLREVILPALGLTVAEAARQLGVSPRSLSRVLGGVSPIRLELAIRIELWMGVDHGGSARLWLDMQRAHDLWHARQAFKKARLTRTVKPLRLTKPEWAE